MSTFLALLSTMTLMKAATLVLAWTTFGLLLRARGSRTKKSDSALERAYTLAIQDYARGGNASAREISTMLGIPEDQAEGELHVLAAENPTRIEVDAQGDVRFRVGEEPQSELEEFDERLAAAEKKKKAGL